MDQKKIGQFIKELRTSLMLMCASSLKEKGKLEMKLDKYLPKQYQLDGMDVN